VSILRPCPIATPPGGPYFPVTKRGGVNKGVRARVVSKFQDLESFIFTTKS